MLKIERIEGNVTYFKSVPNVVKKSNPHFHIQEKVRPDFGFDTRASRSIVGTTLAGYNRLAIERKERRQILEKQRGYLRGVNL